MNELKLYFTMVILSIGSFVFFRIGQTRPDRKTRNAIREELEKKQARELALGKVWKCTKIIRDYPGTFGGEIKVMVLDSGLERTLVMYSFDDNQICSGDRISFRMRDEKDIPKNVWVSLVDRYCIPYRLKHM